MKRKHGADIRSFGENARTVGADGMYQCSRQGCRTASSSLDGILQHEARHNRASTRLVDRSARTTSTDEISLVKPPVEIEISLVKPPAEKPKYPASSRPVLRQFKLEFNSTSRNPISKTSKTSKTSKGTSSTTGSKDTGTGAGADRSRQRTFDGRGRLPPMHSRTSYFTVSVQPLRTTAGITRPPLSEKWDSTTTIRDVRDLLYCHVAPMDKRKITNPWEIHMCVNGTRLDKLDPSSRISAHGVKGGSVIKVSLNGSSAFKWMVWRAGNPIWLY